ncbi:MAG: DUF4143 domain-containing protein [Propionibacteriaceae bacterium]|nr:DUF4143 domain-containing protein [Propionibacteriaceae bacterium]
MRISGTYQPRIVDDELRESLSVLGAVVIEGPRACGKTWTATNVASSRLDVEVDPTITLAMETDPSLLLRGPVPRLLDEWQVHPALWDVVRREVDARQSPGQFILTGSAIPSAHARTHSGAGRFGWVRMRPMSLWESGDSTGEVTLRSLFNQEAIASDPVAHQVWDIARLVVRGGWPETVGLPDSHVSRFAASHLRAVSEIDLSQFGQPRRDTARVRRLLRSLARAESSEMSVRALTADVGQGDERTVSRNTVIDYLAALEQLMVTEDQPAWSAALRSRAVLRSTSVRRLADPSLAAAALGVTGERLVDDLETLGLLFESLVVRDLRVYAQVFGGQVYHFRDSYGHEIDAIIEHPDGTWGACEIKLGLGAADRASDSLRAAVDQIDTRVCGQPTFLAVITGTGLATRRSDGVYVLPVGAMRP